MHVDIHCQSAVIGATHTYPRTIYVASVLWSTLRASMSKNWPS
jgi:hypothetical protein